jgi:uncharacterized protein YndB with AHSA1/START domain
MSHINNMSNTLMATSSMTINVPAEKVWEALTTPEMIKQYLFGTTAVSDWKVGSPLIYRGEWQGKQYEDKGTILRMEENKLFEATYWSSMSGKEDLPENYNKVTYELEDLGEDQTKLTITQDNVATEQEREHSEKNWGMVLETLKKMLENRAE